jgi:amino acid adenylation domain-containing protein
MQLADHHQPDDTMAFIDIKQRQSHGTIIGVLQEHARTRPDALAFHYMRKPETGEGPSLAFAELDTRARQIAALLKSFTAQDDRVLLLLQPGLDFITAFLGCLYAGTIAVPLFPPRHGDKLDRISHVILDCGARCALSLERDIAKVGVWFDEQMRGLLPHSFELVPVEPASACAPIDPGDYRREADHLAFLQYTSGSTGDPKGVKVSHGNLMANQEAIASGFASRTDDVCVSWLPLYHDMGLIGATLHPLYCGYPSHFMTPVAFIKDPLSWLESIARCGATVAGGPDFCYQLCTRAADASPERAAALDLSRWRVAFNGAEPIRADSMARFVDRFACTGFDPGALFPCYGLAEATLFVAGALPGRGMTVWTVSKDGLAQGRFENAAEDAATQLVSCGRCPPGHELRIVADGREVEEGRIGEIWVGGPSVASGYWGRGESAAPPFQARIDGDASGRRYLRTGDLGCRHRGELVVTGRAKDVIILNGRNYYPQDIEAAAGGSCPAARMGCAAAFSLEDGGAKRIAIVQEIEPQHLTTLDTPATTRAIRLAVAAALAIAVDDVVLIHPGNIPKTSSGKIRRAETRCRLLNGSLQVIARSASARPSRREDMGWSDRILDASALQGVPAAARAAHVEECVRNAISQATEQPIDAISPDASLTGAGLSSIAIVQLQNALERDLGVRIDARELFDGATLRDLARTVAASFQAPSAATTILTPAAPPLAESPLSHQQQQLWFLYQLDPSRHDYNLPLLVECRPGLDKEAFLRSVERAVQRHSILRTTYRAADAGSVQAVGDAPVFEFAAFDLGEHDENALRDRFRLEALKPFDLEKGPVLRAGHARLAADRTWAFLCVHHIASDFWSLAALVEEVFAECAGVVVTRLPRADYREWCMAKADYLRSAAAAADLDYWQGMLPAGPGASGLAELARGHGHAATRPAGRIDFRLPKPLLTKAERFAKAHGKTLNAVCLAAYQLLLHCQTRLQRLVVGTMTAGRDSWRYENTQGYFVNPIALVTDWRPEDGFDAFLERSSANLAAAMAHQGYPFSLLVKEYGASRRDREHPFFQAVFLMQQSHRRAEMAAFAIKGAQSRIVINGLHLESVQIETGTSPFDLMLTMAGTADGAEAMLEYGPNLLSAAQAEALAAGYVRLLAASLVAPERPPGDLAFVSASPDADQRGAAAGAGSADNLEACRSLAAAFARQLGHRPDQIALTFGETALTYMELNRRANLMARRLAGNDSFDRAFPAAILLHRSPEVLISILAVLKAGASYLPLDPHTPPERLAAILADADPSVLITSRDFVDLISSSPRLGGEQLLFVEDGAADDGATVDVVTATAAGDRAYVIFTSGSTGRPKGVQVTHGNVLRLFTCSEDLFRFDEHDVWTLFHSFAFDFSVWEMWGALLHGGRLVIVPYEVTRSPAEFRDLIRGEQVTVLNQTPSAFGHLAREDARHPDSLSSLRTIVFGGEALVFANLRGWLEKYGDAKPRLVNMYGITETTVHVTYRPVSLADLDAGGSLIGLPLPDLCIELLDGGGRRVPTGAIGEIHVGGAGLSQGYLGKEALTRERFVDLELDPGRVQRFYRSGDMARMTSTGEYEFLGRQDQQVSINGFRIELSEIEAALLRFPGITAAAAVVHGADAPPHRITSSLPDAASDMADIRQLVRVHRTAAGRGPRPPKLTAYIVAETLPDVQAMYRHLSRYLADYMVPQAMIAVPGIPLNHNGKVDTVALAASGRGAIRLRAAYVAPRTPEEQVFARLFAEVLDVSRVGANDGFFELGGDSIRIIQLRSRALKAGMPVSVQDVFRLQTPAALAAVMRQVVPVPERPRLQPFAMIAESERQRLPAGIVDAYPLARLQEGLLFHSLYDGDISMYCDIFEFRVRAPYDEAAFAAAVQGLMDRHPIFRTSFHFAEFDRPLQLVHEAGRSRLEVIDHRGMGDDLQRSRFAAWLEADKQTPHDVASAPLVRFSLHRLAEDEFIFTMSFHDALLDGWSESSTISELLISYFHLLRERTPPDLHRIETGFCDFVALEREMVDDPGTRSFWKTELEDIKATKLPSWSSGSSARAGRMRFHAVDLAPELSDELKALARQLGVSLKHVLLAAHAAVMSFVCGESEIVMAVESNGRLEDGDGDRVLGTHLNVVPWRLQLADESWETLIRRVHGKEVELQPYRRFPYQEIQRLKNNAPLFDVSFNYTHFHVYEDLAALEDLEILDAKAYIQTHFALRVEFNQDPFTKHLTLDLEANVGEVPVEQVRAIGGYFRRALETIAAAPSASCVEVQLLADAQLEAELAGSMGPATVADTGAMALYVAQLDQAAALHAGRVAATDARRTVRYDALIGESQRTAANLRRHGVARGDVVALLAERSIELLTTIIGLFRVGAAFVPLPAGPIDRVNQILTRAGASHLVFAANQGSLEAAMLPSVRRVKLELLAQEEANLDGLAELNAEVDSLAYMIFTSGSTGEPKGVMIEHGGMINHMHAKIEDLGIDADDKVSQDAAATFDICVWQFLAPLLVGAQVRIFEDDVAKDAARLLEQVVAERVSILEVSPSVLGAMLVAYEAPAAGIGGRLATSALRWVVSSGETLQPSLVHRLRQVHPAIDILNMWGATETSDDCTHYRLPRPLDDGLDNISIGHPIRNSAVYVLDPWRRVVPRGTPGELYVGGLCVGRGYANDPRQTANAFLTNDVKAALSTRLYRTGDRGCRRADGRLYFIGRRDNQVKIRGHRIEIDEVEAALDRQPTLHEAAVLALRDAEGQQFLAAWVVPLQPQAEPRREWVASLRTLLRRELPAYMVPDMIVPVTELPKNVNGKVDRKALALPAALEEQPAGDLVAPQNSIEEIVLGLFCRILKRQTLSTEASFFEAGGNSLLATQVVAQARRRFNLEVPIRALFEHDTAALFSSFITEARSGALPPDEFIPAQNRSGSIPLSLNQERLWFISKIDRSQRAYGSHLALHIQGPLDPGALGWALQRMVDRHEILRTCFRSSGGRPQQEIADAMELTLAQVDLSRLPPAARRSARDRQIADELCLPFQLDRLPLCKARLFRLAEEEYILLWRNHHIIGDGWSAGVMLREVEHLYAARLAGEAPRLPALPIQFADYAIWQQAYLESAGFARQLAFWDGYLAGHPGVLDLPTDFERPQHQSFEGRRTAVRIPTDLTAEIRALCQRCGVTMFAFLQCALGLLLSRYAKQGDLLIGAPVANRRRVETEPLIGFLTNTLPIRLRYDPAGSFAEHMIRLQADLLDVFENQDVPFAHLVNRSVKDRDPGVSPLVQVLFVLQNEDLSMPRIDGLRIEPIEVDRFASILDLMFDLQEAEGQLVGHIEFNCLLFDEKTIAALWRHFCTLVRAIVEGVDRPVAKVSAVEQSEIHALNSAWRELQRGRSEIQFWHASAPETPHWDEYVEAAERKGMLLSAYMAISEY